MTLHPQLPADAPISAFLDHVLAHTPSACALLDTQERILCVNPAFAALTGRPAPAHVGEPLRDALPPGATPYVHAALQAARGEQPPPPPSPDGLHYRAFTVAGPDGQPAGSALLIDVDPGQDAARAQHLQRITGALARAFTSSDLIRTVLEQAVQATGAFRGTLIKSVEGDTLYLIGSTGYDEGFDDRWRQFNVNPAYPITHAVLTREAVFGTRALLQRDFPDVMPMLDARTQALVILPLLAGERLLGALTLSFDHEDAVLPARQAFARTLADACASALERARLYDAERAAGARAALLAEVSGALAASLEVRPTIERIATLATAHLADWAAVFLPDETGRMQAAVVAHDDPRQIELLRWLVARFPSDPAQYGSSAWVQRTGEPILLPAVPPGLVDGIEDPARRDAVRRMGLHSLILVPLTTQGRHLGVLGLATTHPERTYGPDDLALARELAQRAAMALDNASLFEASQRREARYRSLIDATRQTVWTTDDHGDLRGEQPGWTRLTGQAPHEHAHGGWIDHVHPDDRARTFAAWQDAVQQRHVYEVDHRLRVADGTYRHFHVRAVPVHTAFGDPPEWVGVHTDVTDRVRAEAALRDLNADLEARVQARTRDVLRLEERLATIIGHLPISLFALDDEGRFTLAEGHGALTGADAVGHSAFERYAPFPDLLGDVRCALAGEAVHAQRTLGERVLDTWYVPQHDETGRVSGVLGLRVDVTQRARVEAELARSNAELSRFAFVAAHDLQEPLRTIISFTELLERKHAADLSAGARRYLSFIVGGARRMKTLVDDLLAYSRVSADPPHLRPVPLSAAVTHALDALDAALHATAARVHVDALPDVLGDEGQLAQVFQNLIGNAVKFRRDGTSPEVRIHADRTGEMWHVRVHDNGIGMDPAYLERIFVMFQRLHAKSQYEGTGLGLAICQKIIEAHGGRIWADSAPGQGSTFHFTLRDARAPAPDAQPGPASSGGVV
ncbi:ATP-binding protein [Deinococcus maricopensis]|uniref:ATP-binding protein n=1 Tax=Deinococcus maricopensis TaxID=309887 RepID=UPI0002FB9C1D|nr:ATP-binding protein [Deinococcus maricopensis]